MAAARSAGSGDEELTDDGSCGASALLPFSRRLSGGDSSSDDSSDSSSDDDEAAGAGQTAASAARQRAQAGSSAAQFELGKRYQSGNGVVTDGAEAVRWFRRAAMQGHTGAQHRLALCLAEGTGAPRDSSEAVNWLKRAANKGHAASAAELVSRERQLTGYLKANVVVMSGRTARPAAELAEAALASFAGCTLELELRQAGGWETLSGVLASAPARRHTAGTLLLSLQAPRSPSRHAAPGRLDLPAGEPQQLELWSSIVTDRRIRRYCVTAGPAGRASGWAEGRPLSPSERASVQWRRASSCIPDLRGESWCETWDSIGRSLGRDPSNLAAAFAQHAALHPELCEGCLGRRPSFGLPGDGGRARWCRRCAVAVRAQHPNLVNIRTRSQSPTAAAGSSPTASPRAGSSQPGKPNKLSCVQVEHLKAVSKATRRVRFGLTSRGNFRRTQNSSLELQDFLQNIYK